MLYKETVATKQQQGIITDDKGELYDGKRPCIARLLLLRIRVEATLTDCIPPHRANEAEVYLLHQSLPRCPPKREKDQGASKRPDGHTMQSAWWPLSPLSRPLTLTQQRSNPTPNQCLYGFPNLFLDDHGGDDKVGQ